MVQTKKELKSQGKKNRAAGARFELKVRKHLEENGWITDKWTKNVDLEKKILIPARRKFIPGKGFLGIGSGFPDFIAFKEIMGRKEENYQAYKVIGVESKSNGFLDKKEKERCEFLLEKGVFKNILIARKGAGNGKTGRGGGVEYVDFLTKEKRAVF